MSNSSKIRQKLGLSQNGLPPPPKSPPPGSQLSIEMANKLINNAQMSSTPARKNANQNKCKSTK